MDDQTQQAINKMESSIETRFNDLAATVFKRFDEQRDELNQRYKEIASIDARVSVQERSTDKLMTTISDNRAEHKAEMSQMRVELTNAMTSMKSDLTGSIDGLKGSVDELNKSYAEAKGGAKTIGWLIESSKLSLAAVVGWFISTFTSGGGG
jgi:protein subunit release factor B